MLIRKKLPLIMMLLVTIPMILLYSVYYIYISGELTQNKKDEMDKVLDMEQEYLHFFFDTRMLEVNYLAKRDDVGEYLSLYQKTPDRTNEKVLQFHKKLNADFAWISENSNEIEDVFVLDSKGTLIASGNPDSYWINLSERAYFKDAMKGKTVISNLISNKLDGRNVILVSAPVFDSKQEQVIGVMVSLIDMEKTSEGITNLTDSETGEAYLVDSEGTIIFHKDIKLIAKKPLNIQTAKFMESDRFKEKSGNTVVKNGFDRVYIAYRLIENTQWRIVLEKDMNEMMSSAYRALFVMTMVFFITIILAIWVSAKMAHSITFPLTELTKITNRTKAGDLFSRFSYDSKDEYGQLAQSFNTMLDELHATEEELRINNDDLEEKKKTLEETQHRYNLALKSARDVVWEWDIKNGDFFASDHWRVLLGEVNCSNRVNRVAFEQVLDEENTILLWNQIEELIQKTKEWIVFDFPYINEKNEKIWCQIKASGVMDDNEEVVKITGTLSDNSEQKRAEEKIWKLAFIDQLTELPNRTAFKLKLEEYVKESEQVGGKTVLFLMDMDNFKRINDTLGHAVGDILIIEAADRLRKNGFEAFRLAGDEFAIVFSGIYDLSQIEEKSKFLHELFQESFLYQGRTIMLSVSIGSSVFPDDGGGWEKLIQNADTALHMAKDGGKSKTVVFNQVMLDDIMKKLEIETIVRRAVKDHLICMYYQPQFSTEDSEFKAFEALMRLRLEDGTMISPADFIPVAEETGVIVEMGEWAMREVFEKIRNWSETGFQFDYVSVNVSEVQLRQQHFEEMVLNIAKEKNIEPESVEIEITESTFMDSAEKNIMVLTSLKELGFRIALDDFGTGYSSFQYLQTLPITTLKIDKSFIDVINHSKKAESIVKQIIEIGHEMELRVVAEGVENEYQKDILCRLSCDFIQGYFYSKPLPLEQTEILLKSQGIIKNGDEI